MISFDEAMEVLKSLSRTTVAFVKREGNELLPGSGLITNLTEEGFVLSSVNGFVSFGVALNIEGTTFDVSAPIFAFSEEEQAAIPMGALLSEGLLIDFPIGDGWIFLMEPPKGR